MKIDAMDLEAAKLALTEHFKITFYEQLTFDQSRMLLQVLGVNTVDEAVSLRTTLILTLLVNTAENDPELLRQEMACNAISYIREKDFDACDVIVRKLAAPKTANPLTTSNKTFEELKNPSKFTN